MRLILSCSLLVGMMVYSYSISDNASDDLHPVKRYSTKLQPQNINYQPSLMKII